MDIQLTHDKSANTCSPKTALTSVRPELSTTQYSSTPTAIEQTDQQNHRLPLWGCCTFCNCFTILPMRWHCKITHHGDKPNSILW